MKFESLEHFSIDPKKITVLGVLGGICFAAITRLIIGDVLGQATIGFELVSACLFFYMVISLPRRLIDSQRVSQAKEAILISLAASASVGVTGSRTRTFLMMRSGDHHLETALSDLRRLLLLGTGLEEAVKKRARGLASYSAANVLTSAAAMRSGGSEGDEETQGLASSSQLAHETKLPVFMTVCFFSPILLLLYSVFGHLTSLVSLAELVALQIIIVDIAFYLCAGDRRLGA